MEEYIIRIRVVTSLPRLPWVEKKGNFHMSLLWHPIVEISNSNCSQLNRKRGLSLYCTNLVLCDTVNVHIYRLVYTLFTQLLVTKVLVMCFGSSSAALKLVPPSCSGHQRWDVKWGDHRVMNRIIKRCKFNPKKEKINRDSLVSPLVIVLKCYLFCLCICVWVCVLVLITYWVQKYAFD